MLIYWNNLLCFENTINWMDIVSGEGATIYDNDLKNRNDSVRKCEEILFKFYHFILYIFRFISCALKYLSLIDEKNGVKSSD